MKLTELIIRAQSLLAVYGDLELLDEEDYSVANLSHEVAEGFPESYGLPDGAEFIRVTNYS